MYNAYLKQEDSPLIIPLCYDTIKNLPIIPKYYYAGIIGENLLIMWISFRITFTCTIHELLGKFNKSYNYTNLFVVRSSRPQLTVIIDNSRGSMV